MTAPSIPENSRPSASAGSQPSAPEGSRTSSSETFASSAESAQTSVDVAIIGGGAGGLAASIALARSLRSVVVIDAGQLRNSPSPHAHNVLGHEGIRPQDLVAKGRAEAAEYGVAFIDATVQQARTIDSDPNLAEEAPRHRFELTTSAGVDVRARRIIIATGLSDELPDIPGLAEGWGDTVLHCPYCHGYEVRGQRIGVIGTTAMSYHQAMLFSQLSDHVSFIRHAAPAPDSEQAAMLETLGIEYIDSTVTEVARTDSDTVVSLTADESADGASARTFDALAVGAYARANAELFSQLGGDVVAHPSGMGTYIPTQMAGQTDVPGVWAVGNSADVSAMVVASTASGVLAGAHINADLIMERLG
ncbi:NAD(P)/FAD-dependent oxidoreductase [Brevibacterium linens]|uniref:Thioredoxin reductase n=1 Tax=Brevibacterium linens TaxID=1703 RepID=A0A2H1K218_BRELN|nr:NAD(P)/FAD-dependent oxidoreductase [Brevibacterium linens]AZU01794.1 NAD(P)/FAD-dependent oxidoreductase [Brevibacterium linens]SMX93733.1 Thioredoxin reductase [Brevibacterium linens]